MRLLGEALLGFGRGNVLDERIRSARPLLELLLQKLDGCLVGERVERVQQTARLDLCSQCLGVRLVVYEQRLQALHLPALIHHTLVRLRELLELLDGRVG